MIPDYKGTETNNK